MHAQGCRVSPPVRTHARLRASAAPRASPCRCARRCVCRTNEHGQLCPTGPAHSRTPPAPPPTPPPQIHLTPSGAAGSVSVDFVTLSGQPTSCKYGLDATLANTAAATSQMVDLNGWKAQMNQAEMTGLTANTDYFYQCGSTADGFSKVFNFTHAPVRQRYAVYADFGLVNDQSLPYLIKDSAAGGFDYVVHAGDWSVAAERARAAARS